MTPQHIANPELVKSMNQFYSQQSPTNEKKLIEEIHQANFIIPVYFEGQMEEGEIPQGSSLSFKTLMSDDEETFLMVFTDWEELQKWSKGPEKVIPIKYEDLRRLILDIGDAIQGFTVNPYEQNLMVTKDLIAYFDQFLVK